MEWVTLILAVITIIITVIVPIIQSQQRKKDNIRENVIRPLTPIIREARNLVHEYKGLSEAENIKAEIRTIQSDIDYTYLPDELQQNIEKIVNQIDPYVITRERCLTCIGKKLSNISNDSTAKTPPLQAQLKLSLSSNPHSYFA